MAFVSQAGLAITLANTFPTTYGSELGGALFSFILGGVAIHELVGPAMLQAALGLAKESPQNESETKAVSDRHKAQTPRAISTGAPKTQRNQIC